MRLAMISLLVALCTLSGCHYYSSYSYDVHVGTEVGPNPSYAGLTVSLNATYDLDNVSIHITDHEWVVTSADGAYTLVDNGLTGEFTPMVAGNYTIKYRTWYYTEYDYCCYATEYRESVVVLTVLDPVPG